MANKTLTARVRLDTKNAEVALKRLDKQINQINKAVNKTKATNLEKQLSRCGTQATKLRTKLGKVNSALSKTSTTANRVKTALTNASSKTLKWASAQHSVNTNLTKTKSLLGSIGSKLKTLLGAYIGIQTAGLAIKTSDKISSSKNLLNNLPGGSEKLTSQSMDKTYAAAQRSRSSYTGMLANVGKTMTLAGDSFQNNVDNAIRFQEIMAKAYTIGGAEPTEAHTSMYQLVQALGSGILQGDELRSVREGAPIAYKEIEKFAQGVLNTEESLKELASQGVITSDIVVAAIMGAEEKINKSFKNTNMTFAQAWDKIKNMTTKAFEPVFAKLEKLLNSKGVQSAIDGIGTALVVLANITIWVLDIFETFFNWCANNWEWLKYIVIGGLITALILLGKAFLITAAKAVLSALSTAVAWLKAHWALVLIVAAIMAILYVYELWRQGTVSTTEAIVYCLLVIAAVALVAGIALGAMWMIWVALAIVAVAIILMYFAEVCGAVTWFGILCKNVGLAVANFFIAVAYWIADAFMNCIEWIVTAFHNSISWIINFGTGLWNSMKAIAENIGIAFQNAWIWAQNSFWTFIAGVLKGVQKLEPVINAVAQAFGKEGFTVSGLISDVENKQQAYKSYTSVGDAWDAGYHTKSYESGNYRNLKDSWNKGMSTFDVFQDGWSQDAYNVGYKWGQGVENSVNKWGSQFQNKDSSYSGLGEDLFNKLGLGNNALLDPNGSAYALGDSYDPSGANADILKGLDKLNGTTDDIKDSMDLRDDDLEFLRRIADMEWRKEFTTAEIRIDMTNNNTVNSDRDLDGIVDYLADVLRDEMSVVAEGVHY